MKGISRIKRPSKPTKLKSSSSVTYKKAKKRKPNINRTRSDVTRPFAGYLPPGGNI